MNKKIFFLPALFVFSTILYISCCGNRGDALPFYKVTGAGVSMYGSGTMPIDTFTITHTDSVFLSYGFFRDCLAKKTNPFSFLGNEAYAFECPEAVCGESGLKSRLTSFTITSDSVYNGIAAGASLNDIFRLNEGTGSMSLDSIVNEINLNQIQLSWLQLFTTTKPANNYGHIFKLTARFADSTIVNAISQRIYWN